MVNAEHAGSDWVWEARLRTAEDLERQAADLRARRYADKGRGAGAEPANQAVRQNSGVRSTARQAAAPKSERSQ